LHVAMVHQLPSFVNMSSCAWSRTQRKPFLRTLFCAHFLRKYSSNWQS